jgi:hypothetical protein
MKELIQIEVAEEYVIRGVYKLEDNETLVSTYSPFIPIEDLPIELQDTASSIWTEEVMQEYQLKLDEIISSLN